MKINRMFELGFTQLGIIGASVLAIGLYIMAEHNKYLGLWISFIGLVVIGIGAVVHIHKVFAESDRSHVEGPHKQSDVKPLLLMSLGAIYLDSPEPGKMTAWVRIKNAGNAPAYKVKAWQSFMRGNPHQNPFDEQRPYENEVVLSEGQEINLYSTLAVTPEQIDALSNSALALYVWGQADYEDAGGQSHNFIFKGIMTGPPETVGADGRLTRGWGFRPTRDGYQTK